MDNPIRSLVVNINYGGDCQRTTHRHLNITKSYFNHIQTIGSYQIETVAYVRCYPPSLSCNIEKDFTWCGKAAMVMMMVMVQLLMIVPPDVGRR